MRSSDEPQSPTTAGAFGPSRMTHAEFSARLGRIAVLAASWASDSLTLREDLMVGMRPLDVQRFLREMRGKLDAIEEDL